MLTRACLGILVRDRDENDRGRKQLVPAISGPYLVYPSTRGLSAGKSVKLGFGLGLRSTVNADRHICLEQSDNETHGDDGDSKHTV